MAMPISIEALGKPSMKLTWPDDHVTVYTAQALRRMCGCAYCVEEMTGRQLLDPASVPDSIVIQHVELIGQYAVAIRFSDGHDTGIFTFERLRARCPCCAASA